jgi:hypothetical protein
MNVPTLAMIGKPVLIIGKTKTDVPGNTFEEPIDRVWVGTLEYFTHNRLDNILVFSFQGQFGRVQLSLYSTDVEVYDK